MNTPTPTEFELISDRIVERLNPPDEDVAEVSILMQAVDRIADFVESTPCSCPPDAGPPDWDVDVCGRCAVLGRARDERVEQ